MWKFMAHAQLAAVAALTISAIGARTALTAVPDHLSAPPQNARHLQVFAVGTQVYACTAAADDPEAFAWRLKAPVADLLDGRGERLGRHYAGPTWEWNDGSTVVGRAVGRADAPSQAAIPLLLLQATDHRGPGALAPVTYIQRLETVGGTAPADGCDASAADTEQAVEYAATYVFFVWRGGAE
jgi:hypothetical protein